MTIRATLRAAIRRVAVAGATVAIAAALAAGCGPTRPTPTPSVAPSPTRSPAVSAPPATPSAGNASPSPSGGSGPSLPPGVTVDPGLLEVLPTEIEGVTLEPDATTADEISRDPLLAESALSIAVALAAAPGTLDNENFAVASVIRLRPDVFDEAFYKEWRDTYNEGACEIADGVASERQTEIGGRQTYIGSCVGGAETYHTYLEDQGFLVSVTATGERRFGELIIASLAG